MGRIPLLLNIPSLEERGKCELHDSGFNTTFPWKPWAKKGAKRSHLMCFYKGNQVVEFQLYMIMLQIIY